MATHELNERFDGIILRDTTINVVRTGQFPESDRFLKGERIPRAAGGNDLKYNPQQSIWDINLDRLDDPQYTKEAKIAFIKDALADKTRDAFEHINDKPVNFWRTSPEATELIEGYFKHMAFEKTNKPHQYLEFRTKSLYPDTHQLILDYFARRDKLTRRYRDEGDMIYRLIQLGKEEDAVRFLDVLVDEFVQEKIKLINFGNRPDVYVANVFELLCLSDHEQIARQATDILFKAMHYNYHFGFAVLTKYVDPQRHGALLDKWFQHYSNLDFSVVDPEEVKKDWWAAIGGKLPQATSYVDFIRGNGDYLGAKYGKVFWNEFQRTSEYTMFYTNHGNFSLWELEVLEYVFKNTALTDADRQAILLEAAKTFEPEDSYYENWMLSLVRKAYPDQKVSKEDFDKLRLGRMVEYTFPLDISPNYGMPPWPVYAEKNLEPGAVDSLVAALNDYAKQNHLQAVAVGKKEKFTMLNNTPAACIRDFMGANNRLVWFDTETAETPADHVDLFESDFKKVLASAGYNFEISQQTRNDGENNFSYDIFVKYKDIVYKHSYSESGTDWYNPQRLAKLINRCLIDNGDTSRLVSINTGDQASAFVLGIPSLVKPLLKRYGTDCWAMDFGDEFQGAVN